MDQKGKQSYNPESKTPTLIEFFTGQLQIIWHSFPYIPNNNIDYTIYSITSETYCIIFSPTGASLLSLTGVAPII
jgi:hypothetical protein